MTQIGCVLWLCLFALLAAIGTATGSRREVGAAFGLAAGVVGWLAVLAGYAGALTIVDAVRTRRRKRAGLPPLIGVPRGVVPAIWMIFALTATAAVWMGRRLLDGER